MTIIICLQNKQMSLIHKHMARLLYACYAIGKLINFNCVLYFPQHLYCVMCDSYTHAKLNQIIIIVYVLVGHKKILQTD